MTEAPLESAIYKLNYGARLSSWSTDFSPEECAALLDKIQSSGEVTVVEEEEVSEVAI